MGLGDRIKAWFRGESTRSAPSPSTSPASKAAKKELEAFVGEHPGCEGFLEPRTNIYPTTLLIVAGTGEYLRRPIGDKDTAKSLCDKVAIPLYEAARVGYPRRMREWDAGRPKDEVSLDELPPWPGEDAPEPELTEQPDHDSDGDSGDGDDPDDGLALA